MNPTSLDHFPKHEAVYLREAVLGDSNDLEASISLTASIQSEGDELLQRGHDKRSVGGVTLVFAPLHLPPLLVAHSLQVGNI